MYRGHVTELLGKPTYGFPGLNYYKGIFPIENVMHATRSVMIAYASISHLSKEKNGRGGHIRGAEYFSWCKYRDVPLHAECEEVLGDVVTARLNGKQQQVLLWWRGLDHPVHQLAQRHVPVHLGSGDNSDTWWVTVKRDEKW